MDTNLFQSSGNVQKNSRFSKLQEKLRRRKKENRLRSLMAINYEGAKKTGVMRGESFLNFCSNDYLGLSSHPELIRRSVSYTERYGTGSSASRLVSGSLQIHHRLEEKIADLYGAQACLLFGSGFQANTTLLPSLTGRQDLILADRAIHNSIIQGGSLSRATFRRFRHNDTDHLESLLKQHSENRHGDCWVVTESLFSMDGDLAPLDDITGLCNRYGAYLMIDDAHAFGVCGQRGLGIGEGREGIDLLLGTLGKAGGGYGAFAVCTREIKTYLINYCAGIIYSTAPPPAVVGAADAAFDLIPDMEDARTLLRDNIAYLSGGLKSARFSTGNARSHILPVLLDGEQEALDLARQFYEEKIFVQAIRPPTVTHSRLRITLSAVHTRSEIDSLLGVLRHA